MSKNTISNKANIEITVGKKPLILIADDSKSMRLLLRTFLEAEGYETVEAENGVQALQMFEEKKPDLILLDYIMPHLDGIITCSRIRLLNEDGNIPIIIITSSEEELSVNSAFEAGTTDFITKPVNWAVLRHRIRRLLNARKTEINLSHSEKFASSIINNALDGIITVNDKGIIQSFNPAAEMMFGYKADKILMQNINLLFFKVDIGLSDNNQSIMQHINSNEFIEGKSISAVGLKESKSRFPLELTVSNFNIYNNNYYTIILRDITEQKKYLEKIKYQAYYDALTGLPNRLQLKERLTKILYKKKKLALIFIDLDRFKIINDTLGHAVGDKLLIRISKRLTYCIGEKGFVARMGGDEFTILLSDIRDDNDVFSMVEKLLNFIKKPIRIGENEIHITASIGIAIYPNDGRDADILMRNSDTAMYHAKEKGKNNFEIYSSSLNKKALKRLAMENSIRKALEQKEFLLNYQPIIDITENKLVGFEALVRWQHPKLGLIFPGDFIPIAEDTGLILALGEEVLYLACKQIKSWEKAGYYFNISVNLSARQIQQRNFVEMVEKILQENKLNPHKLEFEITESLLMENVDYALEVIKKLKSLGICFTIDDFGTGYSSLSYLKKLPVDKLKIDKSFIREISTQKDTLISSSVIALGKSLNLAVVAEGIENVEQLNFLKENNCNIMQGYYFGRPMSAEEINEKFLKNSLFRI